MKTSILLIFAFAFAFVVFAVLTLTLLVRVLVHFVGKIPSVHDHINRNQFNVFPVGKLIHFDDDNKYIDESGIVWAKRGFFKTLLHNPFKYYVFESYDRARQSSFEVEANKDAFDKGIQIFTLGTFNFYSSITHPVSHMFADVLPIVVYLI